MLDLDSYLALRQRPSGAPAMFQNWRDLTFLHFSVEPEIVQRTLPEGLTVDTYPDANGIERAWVGLVPFRMEGIRFAKSPAVPGCRAFPETNVRTYVHRQGREPGVWFYSLEASNPFACDYARRVFGLPYWAARMSVAKSESQEAGHPCLVNYRSRRVRGGFGVQGATTVLGELAPPEPGSLEFFLVERYLLYAQRGGRLFTGQVHHIPYPLRQATFAGTESLVRLTGIEPTGWENCLFSPGVDVEVFGIHGV